MDYPQITQIAQIRQFTQIMQITQIIKNIKITQMMQIHRLLQKLRTYVLILAQTARRGEGEFWGDGGEIWAGQGWQNEPSA